MKIYRLIFITLLSFSFIGTYAQDKEDKKAKVENSALRKANIEYEKFSYIKSTELLLELANSGYKSEEVYQKLGNSYYFNNKMKDAAKWYGELMTMNDNQEDTEYYFRYAQALKVNENYEESDEWMNKFYSSNESDLRALAYNSNKDYIKKIEEKKNDIEIYNLDLNSPNSDFGSAQYQKQLVFASSRRVIDSSAGKKGKDKNFMWNDQPFLDLYSSKKKNDSSYSKAKAFNADINSKYHESSASFTPNEKIMFFTRNNYFNDKYKDDNKGTNRLKLFRALLQDTGEWGEIESVHFNSDEYSVGHPSVNVDGTKIYFASDMPGTNGQSDLYVADLNRDGTIGEPTNLDITINTEGQETFPFINEKGDLYFSSNGFPGLGGLDIYVIRDFENRYDNNETLVPENLGEPFNSSYDDFAYLENFVTNEGFLSSNRPGGKGDDDIYSFRTYHPSDCKQVVKGVVKNKITKALIPYATVTLFDSTGENILQQITVAEDADFNFKLDCNTQYLVRGEKVRYSSDEKRVTTPKTDLSLNLELGLELNLDLELDPLDPPTEGPHIPGTFLNPILGINIIYFDFDKDFIRSPDATRELQKVIFYMKTYPTVHVDVQSHTDSRATDAYNDDLSTRRNISTIDYIVNAGISRDRLTGRGYGESQLVNECADGVECSEDKHDLNRRSNFKITKQ
ncbi:OmpA family protein [Lacinutrix jangbogonensis]|uniref:OmpA family protein n=1 Tax=Lacinutrix jangbogonensis TaxID=1469557 RepID=UPI00053D3A2D|nr:OmpA family protein [Lacinutrix jangbogonensis]